MNGKISTAVFLGFTALALSQSGCIVDAGPSNSASCADNRFVTVAWNIVVDATDQPLSCGGANASTVIMDLGPYSWSFPCSDGSGFSPSGLAEGPYSFDLQLLDPNNTILSTTPTVSVSVFHCSQTDVPRVTFGVN